MKSRLGLAVAAMLCVVSAAPANADVSLYEINAVYDNFPSSSITGSFTMDSSVGPASISNVDIHATLPLAGGPFNFNFDQVVNPSLTWPVGYLDFANHAFSSGDTHFWMGFTSLNDGSYSIGMWGNPGNPHPSEISVIGVNDWQGIEGRMTDAPVPLHPLPLLGQMLLLGLGGFGLLAYRQGARKKGATSLERELVAPR
jgi:hypothetical protein